MNPIRLVWTALFFALVAIGKLVVTGVCLAIGFKIGYVMYEKASERRVIEAPAV